MDFETIVVGGGMSGMSAALKLKEAGRDVAIVTKTLGGRVEFSEKYDCNWGAVFFMENYKNATKIVDDLGVMTAELGSLMLHTSEQKYFKGNSLTMILSVPQLNKFKKFMLNDFMPDYQAYKDDCEVMPVPKAFARHPKVERYYRMKASEVIAELGIQKVCDNFVSKFAYACTGSKINELNALDFLNVAQGAVTPIHDFKFTPAKIEERLDGKVVYDPATSLWKNEDGTWRVVCESGREFTAKNVIIAAPGFTTQKLVDLKTIRQPTMLCTYHVKGTLAPKYASCNAHYFGDTFDIIAINKTRDGNYNIYTRCEMKLDKYFTSHEVLDYRVYPEALFVYGDVVAPQDLGDGRIIAGDMNGLGLEPACVSGIYAANRVLGVAEA